MNLRALGLSLVLSSLAACGGLEPSGPRPCPPMVPGIDVSEFNGIVDRARVADGGFAFAFAKASEGLTIRDAQFQLNWGGIGQSGLARGAYHFFHPGDDGAQQADLFLDCTGSFGEGDLAPVLDWETSDGRTSGEAVAAASAFIAEIQARTGLATIIYTYRDYWDSLGNPPQFAANALWFASYSKACPVAPAPWSDWVFWQSASGGTVPGIDGPVDLDRFSGTVQELRALSGIDAGVLAPDAGDPSGAGDNSGGLPSAARTGCGSGGVPDCSALVCWLFAAARPSPRRRSKAARKFPIAGEP